MSSPRVRAPPLVRADARAGARASCASRRRSSGSSSSPSCSPGVLGLAFRTRPPEPLPVAVVGRGERRVATGGAAADDPISRRRCSARRGAPALRRGRRGAGGLGRRRARATPSIRPSPTAAPPASRSTRRCSGRRAGATCSRQRARRSPSPGSRYVDFLVPGLLGMNLMGTGMWGIGFSLVVARNGNLLKRFVAAPVRRSHLLAAQLLSRLVFLVPEAAALLLFAWLLLGVPIRGSLSARWPRHARGGPDLQRPGSAHRRASADHRRACRGS